MRLARCLDSDWGQLFEDSSALSFRQLATTLLLTLEELNPDCVVHTRVKVSTTTPRLLELLNCGRSLPLPKKLSPVILTFYFLIVAPPRKRMFLWSEFHTRTEQTHMQLAGWLYFPILPCVVRAYTFGWLFGSWVESINTASLLLLKRWCIVSPQ